MMKQLHGLKQKFTIKPLFAIAVCTLLVYSSCRKSDNTPLPSTTTTTKTTPDTKAIGGQVALNIAHSLYGKLGGANLMDGVDSVSLTGHMGPHHGYNTSLLCGFFTDSLVSVDSREGDTVSHTGGNLSFYFNCKDGKHAGYTAYDSLGTTRTTSKGLFQNYYVKQYYTIDCLDDKHQFIGVNGSNYFYQLVNISCGCNETYADIENSVYFLKDLTIDVCKKDILSGTATFKAYGQGWSITGKMTFLGNHMADMIIDGNSSIYHVNLLTQTITT
jgi:hypothetical protein